MPNKILKNTSKLIWRPKESIYETLKRWSQAGVRDATWKRFPVVILMHIRSSQQPSCIQQEAQLKQIWKSVMSTQFSTQTNSSKPVTVCGFRNCKKSLIFPSRPIDFGEVEPGRSACGTHAAKNSWHRPCRETNTVAPRNLSERPEKIQPCGCFQK